MEENVLNIFYKDHYKGLLTGLTAYLHGDPLLIEKAIKGICPAILIKLIALAEEEGGNQKVFDLLMDHDGSFLEKSDVIFQKEQDQINHFLNSGKEGIDLIFNKELSQIEDGLSASSGLSPRVNQVVGHASSLIILELIGKQARRHGINRAKLKQWVESQKEIADQFLPEALKTLMASESSQAKPLIAVENISLKTEKLEVESEVQIKIEEKSESAPAKAKLVTKKSESIASKIFDKWLIGILLIVILVLIIKFIIG